MEEQAPQNKNLIRRTSTRVEVPEKKERIKLWVAFFLVILALCVDATQAILTSLGIGMVLGPIISVIAYFVFWIIFMMLGVFLMQSPKKIAAFGGSSLLEIWPGLSAIPVFTLAIITIISLTMAEDKGGIIGEVAGMAQGKFK